MELKNVAFLDPIYMKFLFKMETNLLSFMQILTRENLLIICRKLICKTRTIICELRSLSFSIASLFVIESNELMIKRC